MNAVLVVLCRSRLDVRLAPFMAQDAAAPTQDDVRGSRGRSEVLYFTCPLHCVCS